MALVGPGAGGAAGGGLGAAALRTGEGAGASGKGAPARREGPGLPVLLSKLSRQTCIPPAPSPRTNCPPQPAHHLVDRARIHDLHGEPTRARGRCMVEGCGLVVGQGEAARGGTPARRARAARSRPPPAGSSPAGVRRGEDSVHLPQCVVLLLRRAGAPEDRRAKEQSSGPGRGRRRRLGRRGGAARPPASRCLPRSLPPPSHPWPCHPSSPRGPLQRPMANVIRAGLMTGWVRGAQGGPAVG